MRARLVVVAALTVAVLPAAAAAHISVSPGQAVRGESTEFTITVPAEGGLTTNRVRVHFPTPGGVYAVADTPGWTTRVLTAPDGRLRGAEWTGGLIRPDRYATFAVLGTPVEEGTAVWRSEQGLTNGTVKQWTGPPEADGAQAPETGPDVPGPAVAVEIIAEPAGVGGGGSAWPGVIGIALGVLALVGVGMVWSSRPAALPPDGPEDGAGT